MIFKTRPNIKKQFDLIDNFGICNLIVSGCSFTYNNCDASSVTWPYYLKDLCGFDQVFDCSLPGAGNQHISSSLQWALEIEEPDPNNSLIIVMWSGYMRDDYICPTSNVNDYYPFNFAYSKNVISGITGGMHEDSKGNTCGGLKKLSMTKTVESRAIENYLYISSLFNFLTAKGYKFLFLDYLDRSLIGEQDFELKKYLPKSINIKLKKYITKIPDLYTWAVKHNMLFDDQFHPSPDGHLDWTKKILIPKLQQLKTQGLL